MVEQSNNNYNRVYNFSAGPCVLPEEVLLTVQKDMMNYQGKGLSVMEMSHRSKNFTDISVQCEKDLRTLLDVPENFEVIFLQGGASFMFAGACFNFLGDKKKANYLTTGVWSKNATNEAKKYCEVVEIASTYDVKNNADVADPSTWKIDPEGAYLHYCDNETVHGFEFNEFPFHVLPEGMLLVGDMCSNLCTKKINWQHYACVYAGAQKNVGPAGLTFAIVRKDFIGKQRKDTPVVIDFSKILVSSTKLYNTPSTFPIYVAGLNLAYMIKQGGLEHYSKNASAKSGALYEYIDSTNGFYISKIVPKYRSRINVPFNVADNAELEAKFIAGASKRGIIDIKGHKSMGGIRSSIYNAMPMEGVQALINYMKEFRAEHDPSMQAKL